VEIEIEIEIERGCVCVCDRDLVYFCNTCIYLYIILEMDLKKKYYEHGIDLIKTTSNLYVKHTDTHTNTKLIPQNSST